LVIHQHGAGAAFAAVAAGFCSSQADDFPQIIQQQQIVGHRVHARAAVERELENACQGEGHVPFQYQYSAPHSNRVSGARAQGCHAPLG
jgi:hypothetical protein